MKLSMPRDHRAKAVLEAAPIRTAVAKPPGNVNVHGITITL